ncbi:MAG TPA: hypothetical protein VIF63_03230 [Candidatus Limnocylindrales bacterium]|jgi:hypothetical protein
MTPIRRSLVLSVIVAVALAACGEGVPTASPAPSLAPRPSSPAAVAFVQPAQGSTVSGATIHVVLELTGATIVPETTTTLRPDEGHVHLYVDNQLVSMNYGLEQDVPVTVGSHALKAEFVAADHAPFNPRVWSDEIVFTVTE